ncbi:MAG: hypothetical protein JWM33_3621 [Caulobacteraceae bacterium]|nr:hypothetical protein [Caulobacteraceae bacterium]
MLKTAGYLISCLSVLLLGAAAWNGASRHPLTLAALLLGMLTSIIGMACRWWTYVREHRQQILPAGDQGPLFP